MMLAALAALPALGQDIALPRARPDPAAISAEPLVPLPRPRPAPQSSPIPEALPSTLPLPAPEEPPVTNLPAPVVEEPPPPPRDYQVACPAVMNGQAVATALPPIQEGLCGLQSPLSLDAVSANGRTVPLNAPVITDCGIATALPQWIADVDTYVLARENTRIERVLVGTSYACRNVDNARVGNLSFHAFGDALDVVGFELADGRTVTVEKGWLGTEVEGSRIVRFAHDAACTHFTTVLGPEANAQHHDHLHIDLGCHGSRCTARLCE
jgi:hypothetical protein